MCIWEWPSCSQRHEWARGVVSEGVCRWLQNLMERAVVLGHGANKEETSPALASLVNQYASILAAQVGNIPGHCSSVSVHLN